MPDPSSTPDLHPEAGPPARPGPPAPAGRSRGPFAPFDRPQVLARHRDGHWYPGRLHGWLRRPGGWHAVVTYRTAPGIQYYMCLPAVAVQALPEPAPPLVRG